MHSISKVTLTLFIGSLVSIDVIILGSIYTYPINGYLSVSIENINPLIYSNGTDIEFKLKIKNGYEYLIQSMLIISYLDNHSDGFQMIYFLIIKAYAENDFLINNSLSTVCIHFIIWIYPIGTKDVFIFEYSI